MSLFKSGPTYVKFDLNRVRSQVFFIVVAFAALLSVPSFTFADKVVRDRYGSLVETWHDSNGSTQVRDRYGNLKETRTHHKNGTVDVRDSSGNLIGTKRRTGH